MFQRWTQCDACIFPVSDDRKGNAPAVSPASPCYSLNREKTVFGPLWWVFSRMRAGTMNNSRVAGYTGGEEVSNQGSSSAHNAVCLFIRSRDRIRRPRTIEYICILIRASLEPPARLYVWRRRKKRRKKKFLSPVRDNFSFFAMQRWPHHPPPPPPTFSKRRVFREKKGFLSLLHPLPPMWYP